MRMLLNLFLLALLAGSLSASPFKAYFGPDADKKTLDLHFIDFVDSSKKTLVGCFYEVRIDSVVDAFIRAKKRGVDVKLVVDNDNYYLRDHETGELDLKKLNPFIAKLVKAGIKIKQDNDRSALMHNKFAVIDDLKVWTGSFNLTDTCSFNNENNAVQVDDKALAAIYTAEFEEMFVHGQFGITSPTRKGGQSSTVEGIRADVFFGPEDDPNAEIHRLISNAKQGVYFMQFAMTANELGDIMVEKAKQGLTVMGLFDKILYRSTGPFAEFGKLTRENIPVVVFDSPHQGKLHHKVFIIDPEGDEPKVVFGSGNASANGNKTNDENVMVLYDKNVVKQYFAQFKALYGRTSNVVANFRDLRKIKPATKIDRMTLFVSSNGVATQKLKIAFPARWPVQPEDVEIKIFRLKNGKEILTTSQEQYELTSRGLTIHSANLTAKGEGSQLSFKVINSVAPEIPGLYSLYIEAKAQNQGYIPLKIQPVIEVAGDLPEGAESVPVQTPDEVFNRAREGDLTLLKRMVDTCKATDCPLSDKKIKKEATQIVQSLLIEGADENTKSLLQDIKNLDLK